MNMKFRMYGYFSDYSFEDDPERSFDVHRNNYFEGEIDMNEDGAFVGKLRDHVGLSDIKGVLDNYALMMRSVYHSPALYRAFVDYSKRCGTEINFSIENQAFATKEKHIKSEVLRSCLE